MRLAPNWLGFGSAVTTCVEVTLGNVDLLVRGAASKFALDHEEVTERSWIQRGKQCLNTDGPAQADDA